MAEQPKIVSQEEAELLRQQRDSSLPPPGYTRDEILRMRTGELEKLADELSEHALSIDPRSLGIDREIQFALSNALTDLQNDHEYCLVCTRQDGKDVWDKKLEGWEVVCGDMPEAKNLKNVGAADSTRRIGDTILMRITKEKYIRVIAGQRLAARKRESLVSAGVIQAGERAAAKSDGKIRLIEDPTARKMPGGNLVDVMEARSGRRGHPKTMKDRAFHQQAQQGVDQMLKEGRVPGLPAPGGK